MIEHPRKQGETGTSENRLRGFSDQSTFQLRSRGSMSILEIDSVHASDSQARSFDAARISVSYFSNCAATSGARCFQKSE